MVYALEQAICQRTAVFH